MVRLDKFLCDFEIGTRSEVKMFIKKGLVTVNGDKANQADLKIDENKDKVCFEGKELVFEKYHYYVLNKPSGVVTATHDNHDKTVMDLLTGIVTKDLSPVGRLDKDTEGLLLITDDGLLNHNLLSPKKHVDKTYYVECSGEIDEGKLSSLEQGVDIGDDKPTLPAKAELLSKSIEIKKYTLNLTITEGRFHQVKRMIEAIGGEVTYLKRISFGPLKLDDSLKLGEFRKLENDELDALLKSQSK